MHSFSSCINFSSNDNQFLSIFFVEPIMVQVKLNNPLRIPLSLTDVCLLWRFIALDHDVIPDKPPPVITNEVATDGKLSSTVTDVVYTESIEQVVLEGAQTLKVRRYSVISGTFYNHGILPMMLYVKPQAVNS